MIKTYCYGRGRGAQWVSRNITKYNEIDQVGKMRQKRCSAYEPMQTKVNRELQNPSMIHRTNKEEKFQVKAMCGS